MLAPLFTVLEVIMEVLLPFITARIIDEGLSAGNMDAVWKNGIIMVVMAMLSLLFGILSAKFASEASAGLAHNVREAEYRAVQTYSFSNIDKFSTAGLVTRMTTDITNLQMAFMMIIRVAVRAPIMIISSMIMSFYVNSGIALIFLLAVIVLGIIIFIIAINLHKLFTRVFDKYDDLNASVQENISAIRVVKSFSREEYEKGKFAESAEALYRLFVRAERIIVLNNPVMMLIVYSCIIAVSWFGAHFIVEGYMTTGDITSLFSYIVSILMSLMMFSFVLIMILMSLAAIKRIAAVLEETPDIVSPENPVTEVKDGSVDFENVSFSYKKDADEYTLSDINLHIAEGETVGIIGGTGSGKSSLVNLISRLYDVRKGIVKVGGVDVRKYDVARLRDEVAVVLQKNIVFSGTVLENLRWGNPKATKEECVQACRDAAADEFIERFPDKYDTRIERGGANVSGGQKQRLCIARALLKKPKILILDDSTSAVDTSTDSRIRAAFSSRIPYTTKIIIAQRISSVKHADRIAVLNDGKINGIGTHEELLNTNDIYKEIYESQNNASSDFDEIMA